MISSVHQLFTIDHLPNRTILHEGETYLFFSGTSYLGMAQNPAMQALLGRGSVDVRAAFWLVAKW